MTASAEENATSGTCGDNLTWTLEDGVLTISGTGEMEDYSSDESPWYSSRESITSIVMDDGITNIGKWAFYLCEGLTGVTIPDSVTSIGQCAFLTCTSLTEIIIPDSVMEFGEHAFRETPWLEARRAEDSLVVVNNILIDGEMCEGDIVIPDYVTSIAALAFWECTEINSVTIGNGVTSIGEGAFNWCVHLTSITIPESVTSIEDSAFYGTNLTKIVILNPDCEICDNEYTFYGDSTANTGVIYGYTDSTAQIYAETYGYKFIPLDGTFDTADLDADDAITISDAFLCLTAYANSAAGNDDGLTDAQREAADVDGDGNITIMDASYILQFYAQTAAGNNPTWASILNG